MIIFFPEAIKLFPKTSFGASALLCPRFMLLLSLGNRTKALCDSRLLFGTYSHFLSLPCSFERDLIVCVFFFSPVNRYKLKDSLHLNEISVILSINIYLVPNVLKQKKKIDARNKSSCKD